MTDHAVDTTVQQTVIDNEYGKLDIEIKDGEFPFIHLELHKWSKDIYKEYIEVWAEIRQEMKDRGFKDLYCLIPMEEKIHKFECMFGFTTVTALHDKEGNMFLLMSQEL